MQPNDKPQDARAIAARITAHIADAATKGRRVTAAQAAGELALLDAKATTSNQSTPQGETDPVSSPVSGPKWTGPPGFPTMEKWWALPSEERIRRNIAVIDADRAWFYLRIQAPGPKGEDAAYQALLQARRLTPWPHGSCSRLSFPIYQEEFL